MFAHWLAQQPGSVRAIAGEVHDPNREAARLRPVDKSRNSSCSVRRIVREISGAMIAQPTRNFRACARSVRAIPN
jgi:hypothetical protein